MEPFIERSHTGESLPLIVSIPHAGTHLPESVLDRLASDSMRELPLTDWHVHELYSFLPDHGVTLIHAAWNRFYSDLNRPPDLPPEQTGTFETDVVAMETEHGEVVWAEPPTVEQIHEWKRHVHEPYHRRLRELLLDARDQFGRAFLFDAHSVPSYEDTALETLNYDVYLGNRNGKTCSAWLIDTVQLALEAEDLRVARNGPFEGGYITKHYAQIIDVETLQIELVQRVYMEEDKPAEALDSPRFSRAQEMLGNAFDRIIGRIRQEIGGELERRKKRR